MTIKKFDELFRKRDKVKMGKQHPPRVYKKTVMDNVYANATWNVYTWARNKYYESGIQTVIDTADTIASDVAPFFEKPGVFTAVRSCLKLLDSFGEANTAWSDDYFDDSSEWCQPFCEALIPLVVREAETFPYEVIRPRDNAQSKAIKVVDFNGVRVGWTVSAFSDMPPLSIHVEVDGEERVKEMLKDALWTRYGTAPLLLEEYHEGMMGRRSYRIKADTLVDALPSAIATRHSDNFRRAFAVNENRSLFLYGPPGSGKSTIARQIAKELELHSIRIKVKSLSENTVLLQQIIELFHPGCIIIDDFDRSYDVGEGLDFISYIRRNVNLLVATANERNVLDEALLRPERFDELEFINELDENVIRQMLGVLADEAYELVKEWPIAFIKEYVRRRKWLNAEEAHAAMAELTKRVERLSAYDEDDSDDVTRFVKKFHGKNSTLVDVPKPIR